MFLNRLYFYSKVLKKSLTCQSPFTEPFQTTIRRKSILVHQLWYKITSHSNNQTIGQNRNVSQSLDNSQPYPNILRSLSHWSLQSCGVFCSICNEKSK